MSMDPATLLSTLLWTVAALVMTGLASVTLLDWAMADYVFPAALLALAIGVYAAGQDLKGLETWEIGVTALTMLFLVGIEWVEIIRTYVFTNIYVQGGVALLLVVGYISLVFDVKR